MTAVTASTATTTARQLPRVPGSFGKRLEILQSFHTGGEHVRSLGLSVADVHLGPRGLVPQVAMAVSPQAARDTLGRHDEALDKYTPFNVQRRLLGRAAGRPSDDLFHMTYTPWLARKRTLQPVFTRPRVATYAHGMADVAAELAARWTEAGTVDLAAESRELTLEVLGRSVFGLQLGGRARDLAPHVEWVMTYVLARGLRPVRAPSWLPTPARSRFFRAWDAIDAISNEAIENCRRDPEHDAPLIRQLLEAVDPQTGRALTDEERRADLFAFLLAGHDTTSTAIAYALWQLAMHPDMQEQVAAEARAISTEKLGAEDARQLPFTVQVLHEAMRLCPPAAGVARYSTEDVEVDGHLVPRGYTVIVPIYAIHRDPGLWADPLRFDPGRFAPEQMRQLDRWQYLPFGAGPRSCIGDHFAMLEATLAVATIVRSTRLAAERATFPTALAATLTAAGPVPVRLSARP